MNENKNVMERERIMIWFLIPFIFSCIGFVSAFAMAFSVGGTFLSSVFPLYLVAALCLSLLAFTCYMACFQHKRTAALSAAIISLLTAQWISAVLLFIGYDKQKKLDEGYGETWICGSCGTKETLTQFPYPGMCINCAKSAKNEANKTLKQARKYIESSADESITPDKETALKCLNEIEYIRNNRREYPMVKKSLHDETEKLLTVLIKIDPDNAEKYEEKLAESRALREEYKISSAQKADIEKHNKTMTRVAAIIVTCFAALAIIGALFLDTQLSALGQSINDLFNLTHSL